MAVRRSAAGGLVVVLSWGAGCQLVSGIPDELALVTGGGGAGGVSNACVREAVPPKPAVVGVGGDVAFVAALRSIDLEDTANGVVAGMNLDGLCSCTEDKRACQSLDPSDGKGACDVNGGRDVQSQTLFSAFAYLLGVEDASDYYNALSEAGSWSVLLRVRGYSGEAEDDQVEVAWYETPGFGAVPQWNGFDTWPVASSSVALGSVEQPIYVDPAAYVTGGKLVAALPSAPLTMAGGKTNVRVGLVQVLLVARIEKITNDRYRLREGTLGGRLAVPELFATLSSFRDANGGPFCTSSLLYPATKQVMCEAVDLRLGAPDKELLCEALSFGAHFETEPALLGSIVPPAAPLVGCAGQLDPAFDVCNLE